MPRKYFVEFKEKAVHQIIEICCLESRSLQHAYIEVGELHSASHTMRCGPDTATVPQLAIMLNCLMASQWKKNLGLQCRETASRNEQMGSSRPRRLFRSKS